MKIILVALLIVLIVWIVPSFFLSWHYALGFLIGILIVPIFWKISRYIPHNMEKEKDFMEYDSNKYKLLITRSDKSFRKSEDGE